MADEYLDRSLSSPSSTWPHLPYPYNTEIHSGIYDGDMRNGKGILQPDKAGNFGYELVTLYKITTKNKSTWMPLSVLQKYSPKELHLAIMMNLPCLSG